MKFTYLHSAIRLSKNHPNICSCIQMIQGAHVRFGHISIQLHAGASPLKQSTKTQAFQTRFDTLQNIFLEK